MGCDIHLFTERKRSINNEEKWVNIDHLKLNPYYGGDDYEKQFEVIELYGDRNYRLFAMLADVRNYHDNPIIAEPKGFPNDCSDFVNEQKEGWDGDGHSHSYFTLKELKEFREKNKVTNYAGMMTAENAELVDKGEMPNCWCQGTNQEGYVYREWKYEDDTIGILVTRLEKRLRDEFWLADDADTKEHDDKVRIVFWFDN
jgi:hypothetical protein